MSSSGSGGYGSHGGPTHFYGVIVHDAIKRGNKEEIQKVLADVKKTHEAQGDLDKAIQELEAALAGK
jgi:uncharacterized protein DUF1843